MSRTPTNLSRKTYEYDVIEDTTIDPDAVFIYSSVFNFCQWTHCGKSRICDSVFYSSEISNSDWSKSSVEKSVFFHCKFDSCNLRSKYMDEVIFFYCTFQQCVLPNSGAEFISCCFDEDQP